MKQTILLYILIVTIVHFTTAQGSIDIDDNIQMGVDGQEHLKITDGTFSFHPDVGSTPLIYGNFGNGNVGIGTGSSGYKLTVGGTGYFTKPLISSDTQDGLAIPLKLINHQGSGSIYTSVGIDFYHFNSGFPNARIYEVEDGSSGTYGGQLRFATRTHGGSGTGTSLIDRMIINRHGNVTVYGSISEVSDKRLKKNIKDVTNSMDKLSRIRGVSFQWEDSDKFSLGILAQEVEEVFPELINEVKLRTENGELGETFKSVNYSGLIAPMIEAIKSLRETVDQQTIEIAELRDQVNGGKKK